MKKRHRVLINGEEVLASTGEVLLDAALLSGIEMPYDCRSGQCGTCVVRVVGGQIFSPQGGDPNAIRACQCRIISDVAVAVEHVPDVVTRAGEVAVIKNLAPGVVEVRLTTSRPISLLPGQYLNVRFRGFPTRCFSPTLPMAQPSREGVIHLQIRRIPNGRVSSALGRDIAVGHRVHLSGPFGSAYLRRGHDSRRLVLVAGGTGFAPIWFIAGAALKEQPDREIVLIIGVRDLQGFYMLPALRWLAAHRNMAIIPVVEAGAERLHHVRRGRPTDHLPVLSPEDIVHVAGPSPLVSAVARVAETAGALCYADAFTPSRANEPRWLRWNPAVVRTILEAVKDVRRSRIPTLATLTSR